MRYLIALCALLVLSGPAAAQTNTHRSVADIIFTELERRAVRDYFNTRRAARVEDEKQGRGNKGKKHKGKAKGHGKSKGKGGKSGLPPGLAKRDRLPPGLARKLDRDGRLPPGLQKRDLPPDLSRRLPPPRPGTHRAIVDNHVVLVETATNVLLDVIEEAVRGAIN